MLQFNVLTLDPNQPWKFPPSLQQKLDLEVPGAIDDTFRSRPSGHRHKTRRDNLERLLDDEDEEWDGASATLKKRMRDQMQKDALQPLGRNEIDDDGPFSLGGATRNDGKLKPAGAETEEDVEIIGDMLAEIKEWLTLDVSACSLSTATFIIYLGSSQVATRLQSLLAYMRGKYSYCFWCGMEYQDAEDLKKHCPGETEEEHD